jgi:3-phosphoshikimate 1-carboxyvinyltransferase
MLEQFGVETNATENTLQVYPGSFRGCSIDAAGDHRIAMSAGIAATVANGPVIISGAQCVSKSYPSFWDEYRRLGGQYEQHIR